MNSTNGNVINGIKISDNKPAPRAKAIEINGLINRYTGMANKLRPRTTKFKNPNNNLIGVKINEFAIESNEINSGNRAKTGTTTGINAVKAAAIPLTTAVITEAALAIPAIAFNRPKTNERTNLAPTLNRPTKNLKMWINALILHLTRVLIANCPSNGNENNAIPKPASIKLLASVSRPQSNKPPTAFATSKMKKLRICAATINTGKPTKIVATAANLINNWKPFLSKSLISFKPNNVKNVKPPTRLLKNNEVMNPNNIGIEMLNSVNPIVFNNASGAKAKNVKPLTSIGIANALNSPNPNLKRSNNPLIKAIGRPMNDKAKAKSIAPLIKAFASVVNSNVLNSVN